MERGPSGRIPVSASLLEELAVGHEHDVGHVLVALVGFVHRIVDWLDQVVAVVDWNEEAEARVDAARRSMAAALRRTSVGIFDAHVAISEFDPRKQARVAKARRSLT